MVLIAAKALFTFWVNALNAKQFCKHSGAALLRCISCKGWRPFAASCALQYDPRMSANLLPTEVSRLNGA